MTKASLRRPCVKDNSVDYEKLKEEWNSREIPNPKSPGYKKKTEEKVKQALDVFLADVAEKSALIVTQNKISELELFITKRELDTCKKELEQLREQLKQKVVPILDNKTSTEPTDVAGNAALMVTLNKMSELEVITKKQWDTCKKELEQLREKLEQEVIPILDNINSSEPTALQFEDEDPEDPEVSIWDNDSDDVISPSQEFKISKGMSWYRSFKSVCQPPPPSAPTHSSAVLNTLDCVRRSRNYSNSIFKPASELHLLFPHVVAKGNLSVTEIETIKLK